MISDDDLLLYHYRDGLDSSERARIGAAHSAHPELAQRMQALVARLAAVAEIPEVPVPAEVQARWRAALETASQQDGQRETRAPRRSFMQVRWPLAAAAAVAIVALTLVFQAVLRPAADLTAEVSRPVDGASAPDASAYERGLKWHLASTEQQLASLESAGPEERARLVETIIAQNRMYALAAERAGEPQLARVLRAFAPVLESVAKGGESSERGIAQLNFEMRVMQGRLGAAGDASSTPKPTTL
jgi:hypothetical protein